MSKNTRNRILLTAVAALLLVAMTVGGTMAWLKDSAGDVVNTFAPTTINIEIKEHEYLYDTNSLGTTEVTTEDDYKMVPGATMPKDPFVRVKSGSEECYVFVKVTKSSNFDSFMTYAYNSAAWGKVADDIYYYKTEVNADSADVVTTSVLATPAITVLNTVTKANLDALTETDYPTLTFTAYAIQSKNLVDASGVAITAINDTNAAYIWGLASAAN